MFKVCIVGRANVGKSSIFNRIIKNKKALVSAKPNLTRDRNHAISEWRDHKFMLIDTGGVEKEDGSFEKNWISKNVVLGLEEADLILMVVDGKEGLNPLDQDILRWIKSGYPNKIFLLVINKLDGIEQAVYAADFYKLGISDFLQVSAAHKLGLTDLLDAIVNNIPEDLAQTDENNFGIKVAFVGKPNVGKSSLLNKILGEERVLVSSVPGTTRDAIDTFLEKAGKKYTLIDTAGIKKKINKKKDEFDYISYYATEEAIKRSDICLLLIDAVIGVGQQDLKIAGLIAEHSKGCIILVNKWDLVDEREDYVKKFLQDRQDLFPFLAFAPIVFISAESGLRVTKVFSIVDQVYQEYSKFIPDDAVAELFRKCYLKRYPPRSVKKQPVVVMGGKQIKTAPPLFYVKISRNGGLAKSYVNYLRNNLRYEHGFEGSPINIISRDEKEQFDGDFS
ncbi:MAG: ribosome biogenesis GTPase Der [bacterium]|nr:ribosome biogenesis GTPase Der [bacterium]